MFAWFIARSQGAKVALYSPVTNPVAPMGTTPTPPALPQTAPILSQAPPVTTPTVQGFIPTAIKTVTPANFDKWVAMLRLHTGNTTQTRLTWDSNIYGLSVAIGTTYSQGTRTTDGTRTCDQTRFFASNPGTLLGVRTIDHKIQDGKTPVNITNTYSMVY